MDRGGSEGSGLQQEWALRARVSREVLCLGPQGRWDKEGNGVNKRVLIVGLLLASVMIRGGEQCKEMSGFHQCREPGP